MTLLEANTALRAVETLGIITIAVAQIQAMVRKPKKQPEIVLTKGTKADSGKTGVKLITAQHDQKVIDKTEDYAVEDSQG